LQTFYENAHFYNFFWNNKKSKSLFFLVPAISIETLVSFENNMIGMNLIPVG